MLHVLNPGFLDIYLGNMFVFVIISVPFSVFLLHPILSPLRSLSLVISHYTLIVECSFNCLGKTVKVQKVVCSKGLTRMILNK